MNFYHKTAAFKFCRMQLYLLQTSFIASNFLRAYIHKLAKDICTYKEIEIRKNVNYESVTFIHHFIVFYRLRFVFVCWTHV